MKVCPYCREEVRDEAIKCRYCSSSLLPAQPPPERPAEQLAAGSNNVVYVVDNDLIRFAKFAAAVLAIFVAVGASLYGFNINQAADKVRESGDRVRDTADKIRELADTVRAQKEAVDNQVKAITATDQQIRKAKDDVDSQAKIVQRTAQEINDAATKVALDSQRANDLRKQMEQDALRAHSIVVGIVALEPGNSNAASTKPGSYTVPELAQLYNFPGEFDGKGQTIALIALGGGYLDSDLKAYFAKLKIPRPEVAWVSVDGAKNEPGKTDGSSAQVTLDIEVAGAAAPGAEIVVYFTRNTDEGYRNALNRAVHDQSNRPSVIMLSWGASEDYWDPAAIQSINEALRDAAQLGITVVAATGDNGVTDGAKDGKPHVDFPASSPYVLAIGGSRIAATKEAIISEVAWGGGGGGVSVRFPQPKWQEAAGIPLRIDGGSGRGIPDVATHADPGSGYVAIIGGNTVVVGGTGAGTALWAGLIARVNQGVRHNIGYVNPVLYEKIGPAGVLRSLAGDDAKGHVAGSGWNAVTGWGSPDGRKLLAAFQ